MLEPHMKEYADASQLQVGVAFLILGALYMVSTPMIGMVLAYCKIKSICYD